MARQDTDVVLPPGGQKKIPGETTIIVKTEDSLRKGRSGTTSRSIRARLDVEHLKEQYNRLSETLEGIAESVRTIEAAIIRFESTHSSLSDRISRLEKIVYGGCGIVLTAVLTALIYLVVKQ